MSQDELQDTLIAIGRAPVGDDYKRDTGLLLSVLDDITAVNRRFKDEVTLFSRRESDKK